MLQSGAVFFAVFISLCPRRVVADSRRTNLTAAAVAASAVAADNSLLNKSSSIGGVEVKGVDDTPPLADDDVPPKDAATSERSKVTHNWETGKLIVIAIITSRIL